METGIVATPKPNTVEKFFKEVRSIFGRVTGGEWGKILP